MAANVQGKVFNTWAGPASIAAGLEYREDKIEGKADPLSTALAFLHGQRHADRRQRQSEGRLSRNRDPAGGERDRRQIAGAERRGPPHQLQHFRQRHARGKAASCGSRSI